MLLLDVTPLSLGIETLGGVMTKLIDEEHHHPDQGGATCSRPPTTIRPQSRFTCCRASASAPQDNKSLGKFDLADIPPAPRGMPQVEVTFDIDANGILHVSAKDKATGKEQRIVIKASSGLSEDEIKRMVEDAEAHAAEDQKFRELVEVRNRGDAMVHSVEKALKDLGEKVSGEDRAKAESALADLRTVLKSDDGEVIAKKTEALSQAAAAGIAQQAYAAGQGAARAPGGGAGAESPAARQPAAVRQGQCRRCRVRGSDG